jgi:hypothetical protein
MQEGCLNEQMTGVKKFGETAFGLSFPISANGADVAECPEGRSSIILLVMEHTCGPWSNFKKLQGLIRKRYLIRTDSSSAADQPASC